MRETKPFENLVERDVKVWCEVEVGAQQVGINLASRSLVNGRSKVPAVTCMDGTLRTINQPTQQPCSRKHLIDSHCVESLSEQSRAERSHLVFREHILSRQVMNAE
jgi:hypothetical protein